jgi:WD40 repeat protein
MKFSTDVALIRLYSICSLGVQINRFCVRKEKLCVPSARTSAYLCVKKIYYYLNSKKRIKKIVFLSKKLALIVVPLALTLAAEQISPNLLAATQEGSFVAQNQQAKPYRLALVIGNAAYQQVGELQNPVNDANDMAKTLTELGFEVIIRTDANLRDMESALDEFHLKLRKGGGIGVFFYAGHGMQVDGENYLIPVDAKLATKTDTVYETLPVGKVLGRMEEAENDANIIMLDACRNNPFGRSWSRSAARGLAQVTAPTGSFIAYATAPGNVAADGTGRNGTFTEHILKYLKTPNLSIENLFKQVRQGVATVTGKKQVPWDSSSLIGEFSFNPASETSDSPPIQTYQPPANPEPQPKPSPQPSAQNLISYASRIDLGRTLLGHSMLINSVAITPDGQTLVSGSADKTVKIWNLASGSPIKTLTGHSSTVEAVAISPDGKTIVSGGYDSTIKVWNLASGSLLKKLKGHTGTIESLAIASDGQTLVSSSYDRTIKIWNLANGSLLRTLSGHSNIIYSIAISSDNRTIASASADGTIKIWDLASGSLLKTLTGHANSVDAVAISSDGQTIASASWDNTIKIWDLASGSLLKTLTGHSDWVNSVTISPDGQTIVSGSSDNTIKVWNLASGSLLMTLQSTSDAVYSVTIALDGRTLVSGGYNNIEVWRASQ